MRTSNVRSGVIAGLVAGIIFGIMLQFITARTPAGNRIPMMALIAHMTGSASVVLGWMYHLFDNAVMGAIFGAILGSRTQTYRDGIKNGLLYGLGWWILGGLVLGPFFFGMSLFSPHVLGPVSPLAFQSLLGHVIFGLILGGTFVAIHRRSEKAEVRELRREGREEERELRRAQF